MSRNPFVTSENWRKLGGKDYQIPLSAPLHPTTPSGHPPDSLRNPQTLSKHLWHFQHIAKRSHKYSQTFLTLNRHLLTPSFLPESLLTSLDNSNASQTVWRVLGSSQGFSWGTGEGVLDAWGCFGVFKGVLGVLGGVSVLWEVSRSVFYSIPVNFHIVQLCTNKSTDFF